MEVKSWLPDKWDREADVVVVGYGGAGAVAAVTAAEEGASVLVIEKSPERGQSNTGTASGHIGWPTENDPTVTAAQVAADFTLLCQKEGLGTVDDETAMAFAQACIEVPDWLEKHGIPLLTKKKAEELGTSRGYVWLGPEKVSLWSGKVIDGEVGTCRELMGGLNMVINKMGIEVMLNTPAKRLIQDGVTKEILGVIAENSGQKINIKAKKAVILTCGGYTSPEMMATYVINKAPVPIYASGGIYNTGDGIKIALDAGADLWHMPAVEWGPDGLKLPGFPAAFWLNFKAWSFIVVNRYGKRFKDESVTYQHARKPLEVFSAVGGFPNHPNYSIFDEKTRLAGRIIFERRGPGRTSYSTYNMARELFHINDWSEDNSIEIGKGWIKQANTIVELATKTGVDPAGLESQISKYNEYCRNGADPDLFRPKSRLVPVDRPPYYSVENVVNTINTEGGPKRNGKCQIMSLWDQPIPRLYSGGELGSFKNGGSLFHCSSLGELILTGVISGRNAVAEEPWD